MYDEYHGAALDPAEGQRIAQTLGGRKACIMCNHGPLTVGNMIDEAAWWYISIDSICHAQMFADACGTPRVIDDGDARMTRNQLGGPNFGWRSFQPLYDENLAEQPELTYWTDFPDVGGLVSLVPR